jgi:DNA-binding transcriptional LysR family regulator
VLTRLRTDSPDFEIIARSLNTNAQVEAILSGQIDIGFVRLPIRSNGLVVRTVFAERLMIALPERHRLAGRAAISLWELADEGLLSIPRHIAPAYYDFVVGLFQGCGYPLHIAQEIEHMPTILAFVSGGFGYALLPSSNQDFSYRGVVHRPLLDTIPLVEMGVAYRPQRNSKLLERLLALLRPVRPSDRRQRLSGL